MPRVIELSGGNQQKVVLGQGPDPAAEARHPRRADARRRRRHDRRDPQFHQRARRRAAWPSSSSRPTCRRSWRFPTASSWLRQGRIVEEMDSRRGDGGSRIMYAAALRDTVLRETRLRPREEGRLPASSRGHRRRARASCRPYAAACSSAKKTQRAHVAPARAPCRRRARNTARRLPRRPRWRVATIPVRVGPGRISVTRERRLGRARRAGCRPVPSMWTPALLAGIGSLVGDHADGADRAHKEEVAAAARDHAGQDRPRDPHECRSGWSGRWRSNHPPSRGRSASGRRYRGRHC